MLHAMTEFSLNAERIAAHLVSHATGARAEIHDFDGRQSAPDFLLHWPDGRIGALEVTLIVETTAIAWQGLASKEGWRWPAATSWEFRPNEASFPYKQTRRAVLHAVELCDEWAVDSPNELPAEVLVTEPELAQFLADEIGSLRRAPFRPGVDLYPRVRAEFYGAAPHAFAQAVASWHQKPYIVSHIQKLIDMPEVSERHLFLAPVDEALPARFFTDDFEPTGLLPQGFRSLDAVWVWSNFWHRYLVYRDESWSWVEFPARD